LFRLTASQNSSNYIDSFDDSIGTKESKRTIFISGVFCWTVSGVGITAGAHRLWSHKSYKAKLPMRLILVAMNCVSFQNDVIEWSRVSLHSDS
jgi:fatty-acid desaturase